MALIESLNGKDARERAAIRASASASAIRAGTYDVGDVTVEVVSSSGIPGGVEVFARVYRDGNQLGFGSDGTVDIERFRIFNPPLLVEDPAGGIAREHTGSDGSVKTRRLREDPLAALVETLAHTAVAAGRNGANISTGKVGNTVSTFYPDANVESTSVDGYVARQGVDQTFAAIVAGAGTNAVDSDNDEGYAALVASTTSNQFSQNLRGIALFDTSAIPDGDTISSAVISFYGNFKFNGLGSPAFHVVSSNPASSTALANADYGTLGSTSFGSVSYASYSTSGYNDVTLNASGLATISKTGVSKFGTVTDWDLNASFTGVWASGANSGFQWVPADAAGTTTDPKLVVTHAADTSSGNFFQIL